MLQSIALLLALPFGPLLQSEQGPASPPSAWNRFEDPAPTEFLEAPDVAAYRAADALVGKDQPLRYGALLPVALGPGQGGRWDRTEDGTPVWRVRIESPGALSLGLEFSRYELPMGAELYVRNEAGDFVLGPYIGEYRHSNGRFAIQPVPGDTMILELLEPTWVERPADFEIDQVVYDYRGVLSLDEKAGPSGAAGSCNFDVKCPLGAPYGDIVRSSARTLSGGALCSGALINNTSNDGTRYLLTANHCGSMSNAVFLFNYQRPNCNSGNAPTNQSVSGSTLMAAASSSDYRLVRINQTIPANFNVYYSGWDRTGAVPTRTIGIHHPSGDVKKISLDNNPPQKQSSQWRIVQWDQGVTEGGSSGSPLYNQNQQIIGQLCCGAAACGYPYDDYYGRFDLSFSALKPFLDPTNTNLGSIGGFDPNGGPTGSAPVIAAVSPASIPAISVDVGLQVITLTGTGFTGVNEVQLDGVTLTTNPAQYFVVSDTQILLYVGVPSKLGPLSISVKNSFGSDTDNLAVLANSTPTLDVLNSDPGLIAQAQGITSNLGSQPGDVGFFLFSNSNLPTSLPGIVEVGIGNNSTALYLLGSLSVSPISGWVQHQVPLSGNLPFGTKLYVQAAVLSAANPVLPLSTSNVQSVTVFF